MQKPILPLFLSIVLSSLYALVYILQLCEVAVKLNFCAIFGLCSLCSPHWQPMIRNILLQSFIKEYLSPGQTSHSTVFPEGFQGFFAVSYVIASSQYEGSVCVLSMTNVLFLEPFAKVECF
ncbi:hypothetical protein XELAEV_18027767mg [Xenopus laevis]|uniref:Uncharacterized protein n=1 Tax=Xenopus laevis TaxID=8355 RepID=A0A974CYC3_XENLA|nr:hypothetical protein XELAEV_18027767mg [Xenopus laevis]